MTSNSSITCRHATTISFGRLIFLANFLDRALIHLSFFTTRCAESATWLTGASQTCNTIFLYVAYAAQNFSYLNTCDIGAVDVAVSKSGTWSEVCRTSEMRVLLNKDCPQGTLIKALWSLTSVRVSWPLVQVKRRSSKGRSWRRSSSTTSLKASAEAAEKFSLFLSWAVLVRLKSPKINQGLVQVVERNRSSWRKFSFWSSRQGP